MSTKKSLIVITFIWLGWFLVLYRFPIPGQRAPHSQTTGLCGKLD